MPNTSIGNSPRRNFMVDFLDDMDVDTEPSNYRCTVPNSIGIKEDIVADMKDTKDDEGQFE